MLPALPYAASCVKKGDYGRYLCTLFAPAGKRHVLFTLYAYYQELAYIPQTVTEPMMGYIRLQWWRETIEQIETRRVEDHPLLEGLKTLVVSYPEMRDALLAMITAREQEIASEGFATMEALEVHLSATAAAVLQCAVDVIGDADAHVKEAYHSLGTAYGFMRYIDAIPFQLAAGQMPVPNALLATVGCDEAQLFSEEVKVYLPKVVALLVVQTEEHLQAFNAHRLSSDGKQYASLWLQAEVVQRSLQRLMSAQMDLFHPHLKREVKWLPLLLWWKQHQKK